MNESTPSRNESLNTTSVLWNLTDLYRDLDDPDIARDIQHCEHEAAAINKEYSGSVATLDETKIAQLVARLEEMEVLFGRLATFAYLQFATSTLDQRISAFLQQIREIGSRISRETVFFELEWNTLTPERVEKFLNSEVLAQYRHYLANMRRYAPHQLSQVEEKLLLERAPVGRGAWTILFEKVMGHLKFGEQGRSEEEVLADLYSGDRLVRGQAANELTVGLGSQLHVLTHIFNTLLADKMITDRLRQYGSWVSSMNLGNELKDETVEVLVDAVVSRYDIPQRYYRVKRELLDLDELFDYDRYAPLPHLPAQEIPWGNCREMVLAAFKKFSPEMGEISEMFFARQWISGAAPLPIPACRRCIPTCWSIIPAICGMCPPWPMSWDTGCTSTWPPTRGITTAIRRWSWPKPLRYSANCWCLIINWKRSPNRASGGPLSARNWNPSLPRCSDRSP
jgi:oligoendopeptidase F